MRQFRRIKLQSSIFCPRDKCYRLLYILYSIIVCLRVKGRTKAGGTRRRGEGRGNYFMKGGPLTSVLIERRAVVQREAADVRYVVYTGVGRRGNVRGAIELARSSSLRNTNRI